MGKTLGELLGWDGPMSHSEFLVWHRWLDDKWNEPDLVCWYLMQIAAEIRLTRNSFSKRPQSVRLSQLKIPFTTRREQEKPMTPDEAKRHETMWLAKLGALGGGSLQGKKVGNPLVKREPGPQHAARNAARGVTSNAPNVPQPKGRRGNPPKPTPKTGPGPIHRREGK